LPAGLTMNNEAHDIWFRQKVMEALSDSQSTVAHADVMEDAQAIIDRKRRAKD